MADIDPLSFHRALLNDAARLGAFRDAILKTVKQGDVVVDAGGGTGVLSLFALQAGAAKTYCIEPGGMLGVAQQIAMLGGFADRFVPVPGFAAEAELDAKADILIAASLGRAGIGERLASTIAHLRKTALKKDAKIVPSRVEVRVAPVDAAGVDPDPWMPPASLYGLDFAAYARYSDNTPMPARIAPGSLLSGDGCAYAMDAAITDGLERIDARLAFEMNGEGTLGGFALWIAAELAPGIGFSTAPPGTATLDNLFFPLPERVAVAKGTAVTLRLRGHSDAEGNIAWAWDTEISAKGESIACFVQSTAFARYASHDVEGAD